MTFTKPSNYDDNLSMITSTLSNCNEDNEDFPSQFSDKSEEIN